MDTPIRRREFNKIVTLATVGAVLAPGLVKAESEESTADALKGFIVSDAHFGWDSKRQPAPEEQREAMTHIMSRFPDLDLFVDTGDAHHGDYPHNTNPAKSRQDWVDIIQGGCGHVPFYYVVGNHEFRSNQDADPEMRSNIMGSATCRPYYSFDTKGIHFISFPELMREVHITEEEWEWLDLDLALNRDKSIILLSHNNILGTTSGNEPGYRGIIDSDRLLATFRDNPNVIAWMHGHNHNYQIVNQQNMLFVSNGRIGGFDPSVGKHGIGGIYFEVSEKGLTVKCYSAEKNGFLDTLDAALTQTLPRETSFDPRQGCAYSYGVGGAVNGERIPAYHHHLGENAQVELFLTGCDHTIINDDPKMTKYAERKLVRPVEKILISARVDNGDAGYEYLNPGIRLKVNDTGSATVTMPGDNNGKFTYYRCPPGKQYKVSVLMNAGRKKGQQICLRLHVHDIQGRKLCTCQSEPIDLKKGRQNVERLIEVPRIDTSETIYNDPESDELVNISIEVCFAQIKRDIDIFSITMEQQNSSENTIDAGVIIDGKAYAIDGLLDKGQVARIPVDAPHNARSVNEVVAAGNRRLTYLIRHSNLEWQVRNATAKYGDRCIEIQKMRNTLSDRMEIVITPLGKSSGPYLHRIRKAEQVKVFPFNAEDHTLTVTVGEAHPGAQMEFVSDLRPKSVDGIDRWAYADNRITLEIDRPRTIKLKY